MGPIPAAIPVLIYIYIYMLGGNFFAGHMLTTITVLLAALLK